MIDFEQYGFDTTQDNASDTDVNANYSESNYADGYTEPNQENDNAVERNGNVNIPNSNYQSQTAVSKKKPGSANIVVVGVGGGGNNAVNNMIRAGIKSANFVVMNTDMQALNMSLVAPQCKIQLGAHKTNGLGAGSDPETGKESAEESREQIKAALEGIDLLFVTAGMGGGTGTGAAPVIAEIAKSMGILTVAVVTKPFNFEGALRMKNAEEGIRNLKNFVDTLLVIPNQKLIEVLDKNVSFKRAFEIADDVLRQGVQGVSDVIANPELINLDFADVRTILRNKGLAHMGIGFGKGEKRVIEAVRGAVFSPLLETDIEGATGIIVNISGGEDMLLSEVTEACDIVKQVVDPSANIILGTAFVPDKKDIEITIIATGFVDKATAPARVIGTPPVAQGKPVASAFAEAVAADMEKKEERKEEVAYDSIFANRPQFNSTPRTENVNSSVQQPRMQQQQQVVAERPQQQVRSTPEVRPQPQAQPQSIEEEIASSRIDVKAKQVPAFLRRLRNGRN